MAIDLSRDKRYQLSRASTTLLKPMITSAVWAAAILLLILGGLLLYVENAAGWLLIGLAAWPIAWQLWAVRALARIAPRKNDQSIGALLSSNILGHMPPQPSPADVAKALNFSRGGYFFAARYGITPDVVSQLSSTEPMDTEVLWRRAYELQQRYGGETVGGAAMTAALIAGSPHANEFLPRLSLDADDIESGAEWFNHVHGIVKEFHEPKKTGGFARDWAFGFTPLLERFGVNISQQISSGAAPIVKLESHQGALQQMSQLLTSGARRNAALIGQLGVGKMAVVSGFAERLLYDTSLPKELKHNQIVALDASSLISAAPSRGQLEQLMNEVLFEAHKAKNIIVCLDNAQLFFEEGTGSVDVSNVLLPILEGGALRMILTMDNHRWLQISQRLPALTTALNRISIEPPTKQETIRILQAQLISLEYRSKVTFMYQALEVAYDLGDRYVQEQAMPGKAIKLLEAATMFAEDGYVTVASVRQAIEQMTGVKVGSAEAAEEKETLLNLEALIHGRMINQTRAVQVVSDALRRARSGVRNQSRPIGTFLFLGPTGVGKTELSKALAAVYFGGEDHLVRVDLNEYVRSEDVARLIADAATNEHSLAAQVSRQPFSVVLLDEIEKAHPDVLSTLLQVLDEGVLRDINGREINCRDAIFIATSNAGAQQIYEYVGADTPLDDVEKDLTSKLIQEGTFRPEFINRFDEVVVFTPLSKDDLKLVVGLILDGLNKNLASQKITVTLSEDAKDLLVEAGYDPQLGARPMRRVVQRTVENVIARQMLEGSASPGSTIELSREEVAASLDTRT